MRILWRVGFTILMVAIMRVAPAVAQPHGYEAYRVVRIDIVSASDLIALRRLETLGRDFQVWSDFVGPGPIEVRVAPAARLALELSGLRYEIVIPDLQQHIDEAFGVGERGDFFTRLRSYDEHVQFMSDLATTYPALAEMIQLGASVEGRPLWALRITGPGNDKPGVMYHGAQHGNEAAGASVVAYAARHILMNYGSDPEVTGLVDQVEWFLLPIMNPDGYVRFDRWNANGVDLNRNWGGPGWGRGAFRGPAPFSEPETAAMRDFFLTHPQVRVHLDFHGYVDWLMWPWGYRRWHSRDYSTYAMLVGEARDLIGAAGGGSYQIGTIWDVAYPVSGGSIDYTVGVLGTWGVTYELIDSRVPSICTEFLPTMLQLSAWISDCDGNGVSNADELSASPGSDVNGNGFPDECECFGDTDLDGDADMDDLARLLANFGASGVGHRKGDLDRDRDVDVSDLAALLRVFGRVCQ